MTDKLVRRVYWFFTAICVVIVVAAAVAFRNISQATATADWVNRTHATIGALDRVVGSLVAGDGAARVYIWTGDRDDLNEARGEFNEMLDHLETLKALARDDAALATAVDAFGKLVGDHAEAAVARAALREGRAPADLPALFQNDPGLDVIREVKRRAADIRSGQMALLDQRDHAAYLQAQTTRWVVGTCVVLDVLLLAGVAWLVRDDIAARRRLATTLQEANTTLEARVRERTAELSATNARLTAENLERKWSAQSLEHQLRYNETIVNATSDLVFVVTKSVAVTRVNPAVSLRAGCAEEDILGRPLSERIDGVAAVESALRAGREMHDQPGVLLTRGGKSLAGTFTVLPIRDNDKVVGGVILLRLGPTGTT